MTGHIHSVLNSASSDTASPDSSETNKGIKERRTVKPAPVIFVKRKRNEAGNVTSATTKPRPNAIDFISLTQQSTHRTQVPASDMCSAKNNKASTRQWDILEHIFFE